MSFNRIKYDDGAYDLKVARVIAPGDYRLFKGFNENCNNCFSFDGPKNAKSDVSLHDEEKNQWGSLAKIESLITNRTNKLSDSNEYGKNDEYKNYPVKNKLDCNENLIAEDTRFSNPIEAFRGMDLTSYHYTPFLSSNPQCEIQEDRIGLNSRLKVKDSYVPVKPKIIDQNSILPKNNGNFGSGGNSNGGNGGNGGDSVNFCRNN